jgi:AraC-like DNA-binding protein
LILNQGQSYAITIEAPRAVESFCVFFAAGFAEEVQHSLAAKTSRLLAEPEQSAPPVHFFERTYVHDRVLSPALRRLRTALVHRRDDYGWLQEQFHTLMQRLLQVHRNTGKEVEALPGLRPATREELYRRLHRAKDYLQACFHQSVALEEVAQVACLSTNHLLRTFKQAFRKTPHQYLTELRLRQAQELLLRTECPVTEVCAAVGFASLGSFSWLFRRHVGVAPETYRRQKR